MERENMADEDNHHSQVAFPVTQFSSPQKPAAETTTTTTTTEPKNKKGKEKEKEKGKKKSGQQMRIKRLLKEAELAKRILLFLIEKYNLPPPVIVHALYVNSGDVDATIEYLENPLYDQHWASHEDSEILLEGNMDDIIMRHGFDGLQERRKFLHQVCEEPCGSLSAIEAKLK